MPLTLPNVLCRLGSKFSGAGDSVAIEEAISTLDKTRRAAVIGNENAINTRPSIIHVDSLVPSDIFLYNETNKNSFNPKIKNLCKVKNLKIIGGLMMQTKRCVFPVSVMYTDDQGAVILHAGSVPFAALEAEFHDSAFDPQNTW